MRQIVKSTVRYLCVALVLPLAALAGFGRFRSGYTFFAHALSLIPGLPGDYLRPAYYFLTLRSCSLESVIGFGTYFANPAATVARGVGTGAYCVFGRVHFGERVRVASGVQVLSGQHQHIRDAKGAFTVEGEVMEVTIGPDVWLGAASIIMADVAEGAVVAAGAVVGTPIPARATAAGNPARVLRSAEPRIAPTP